MFAFVSQPLDTTRKTSDSQLEFRITFDLCSLSWGDELIDHELTFTSRSIT